MSETRQAPKTLLQKLLDLVEQGGNKVPHPAVLFFLLIVLADRAKGGYRVEQIGMHAPQPPVHS